MSDALIATTVEDLVNRVGRLEKENEYVRTGFQNLVDQMGGVSFGIGSVLNTIIKLAIDNGWVKNEKELEELVLQVQKEMIDKQPKPGEVDGSEDKSSEGTGEEEKIRDVQSEKPEGEQQETETGETPSENKTI